MIYFLGLSDIWVVSLEDEAERPLTDFSGKRGNLGSFALATDGQYLYFTWEEDLGDIWVMDVVTEWSTAVACRPFADPAST